MTAQGADGVTRCPLSVILCSRNDRYMGNSPWRLETTLNFLAENVHVLGRERQVEILVADWGSEVPLHTVLALTPPAARLVRFLPIPPDIARRHQKDSPFPEVLALNAAARRARGEYIGRIDQDTLVGARFLELFFDAYEGRRDLGAPLEDALLFANRRGIPYRFAVRCPPIERVERFVRIFGSSLPVFQFSEPFWTSYVGIWLAHRDAWFEARGYDETMLYMNSMEVDMIHRLRARRPIVDVGRLVDMDFYHLDHYGPGPMWAGAHRKLNPELDIASPPRALVPNGPDWGLAQHALEVVASDPGHAPPDRPPQPLRLPVAVELAYVGARVLWDERGRPLQATVMVAKVARFAWDRRADVLPAAVHKLRWERNRVRRGLSAIPPGGGVRAVETAKAARKASGHVYVEEPRVAVIVQSFNQGWNVRLLERRLRATCMDELIVCEDGSVDRSWATWKRRLTGPNDFLLRSNDLHEIRSYSRAIGYTRAELICLMQDDDQPPKDGGWLAEAVALFDRYPKLAVLGGWCGFDSYFEKAYNSPARWRRPQRRDIPTREPDTNAPMVFVESVNIGPYLLRKTVYEELGGFDHSFSQAGTPGITFESEFCLRAWQHGYQVALVDIPVKNWFSPGGTLLWGLADRTRNEEQNKRRIVELYDSHMPEIRRRIEEANAGLKPGGPTI